MSRVITITEATVDDAPTVHSTMREAFKEYDGVLNPPSGAMRLTVDDIVQKLGGTEKAILSWVGTEPAGSAQYHFTDTYVYMGRISVIPAFRGQGIAKRMVRHIEELALRNGIHEARLGVRLSLPNNVAYYRNLNYEVVKEHEYPEKTDGWYIMRKMLGRIDSV